MRLRYCSWAKDYLDKNLDVVDPKKISSVLNNDVKTILVIGVGRSSFIFDIAEERRDYNFLGIEKYDSALAPTIKENEHRSLKNIKFLNIDAQYIDKIFSEKSVDKIYINFPDPWPKVRHEKRRLLSQFFLSKYFKLLKQDGEICLKTDREDFYKFSILQVKKFKEFKIKYKKNNLYKLSENKRIKLDELILFKTKYENKFMTQTKICFLKLVAKVDN